MPTPSPEGVLATYVVRRQSSWDEDVAPVDGAKRKTVASLHKRTCSEEEFDRKFSEREGPWRENGRDHTTYSRGIQRTEDREVWTWTGDLLALVETVGNCEIAPKGWGFAHARDYAEIEVKDGY